MCQSCGGAGGRRDELVPARIKVHVVDTEDEKGRVVRQSGTLLLALEGRALYYGARPGGQVTAQGTLGTVDVVIRVLELAGTVHHQSHAAVSPGDIFRIVPGPPHFRRGEVNLDGVVDLSDGVAALMYLFSVGDVNVTCEDAVDANVNGALGLDDAVFIFSYLFAGGPTPGHPFGACGADPPDDRLTCEAYPACP